MAIGSGPRRRAPRRVPVIIDQRRRADAATTQHQQPQDDPNEKPAKRSPKAANSARRPPSAKEGPDQDNGCTGSTVRHSAAIDGPHHLPQAKGIDGQRLPPRRAQTEPGERARHLDQYRTLLNPERLERRSPRSHADRNLGDTRREGPERDDPLWILIGMARSKVRTASPNTPETGGRS